MENSENIVRVKRNETLSVFSISFYLAMKAAKNDVMIEFITHFEMNWILSINV